VRRYAVAALAALLAAAGCGDNRPASAMPKVFHVGVGGGPSHEVATAFALGAGRAVTVAHVLGDRRPGARVRVTHRRRATILAIDQRDDLALLSVPGLQADRAKFTDASGDVLVLVLRGRHVHPLLASVRRAIVARIRTPDGRRVVRRHALELRADIAPGDSGAPVVTADGRIVGVIFAESNRREHTAYAVAVSALAGLRRRPAGRS
jgi:S1-C subfamily serine protease